MADKKLKRLEEDFEQKTQNQEGNVDESLLSEHANNEDEKLLLIAQKQHKIFLEDKLINAFHVAKDAYRGKVVQAGVESYLKHSIETAKLVALFRPNIKLVVSALLHRMLDDDSPQSYLNILKEFDTEVADIVQAVCKLSNLSEIARRNITAMDSVGENRFSCMFLAMGDIRSVIIKLAATVHEMQIMDVLPLANKELLAKETKMTFAALANRVDIEEWKNELQNLWFKHLHPVLHNKISSMLDESYGEALLTDAKQELESALLLAETEIGKTHVISARRKSVYSIHHKLEAKKSIDEIHDIFGMRVIVDTDKDCYKVLEVVRNLWPVIKDRDKDYIEVPKKGGYRSLHIGVLIGKAKPAPLEVQIRTPYMHDFANSSHWLYKEKDLDHSPFVLSIMNWARKIITKSSWETSQVDEFTFKSDWGQEGPVYILMVKNNKMYVEELPAKTTVTDLLKKEQKGEWKLRLNKELVSDFSSKLKFIKMGDVVELTPAKPRVEEASEDRMTKSN